MNRRIVVFALAVILLLSVAACAKKSDPLPKEGTYMIGVTLSGGTGKAKIETPAQLVVFPDGYASLLVIWSSDKYDYMLVDGKRYEPAVADGHSMFVLPVGSIYEPMQVIADTTAMSTPHEIEYTITFDPATLTPAA